MKKILVYLVSSIDLFPVGLNLTYKRKNYYDTKVSNFISLGVITLITYLIVN